MVAAHGPTIRARAIPGFLRIRGAGHPTITVTGPSVRASVGVGSRAARGWAWQTILSSRTLPLVVDPILFPIRRSVLQQLLRNQPLSR